MLVYSDTDPRIKRYLGYRSKLGILHHKIKQLKKIKLNKKVKFKKMSEMNLNLNIFLYPGAQFIHGLCGGIFNLCSISCTYRQNKVQHPSKTAFIFHFKVLNTISHNDKVEKLCLKFINFIKNKTKTCTKVFTAFSMTLKFTSGISCFQ